MTERKQVSRRDFIKAAGGGFAYLLLMSSGGSNIVRKVEEASQEIAQGNLKTPGISPEAPTVVPQAGPAIPEALRKYDGYRVVGDTIYNPNGEAILFRGVSRPGLQWSPTGDHMDTLEEAGYPAIKEWGFSTVRLPLNQVYWLTDANYKGVVERQVNWANSQGLNVILDLHWSGRGKLENADQQQMPDMHSLDFWADVASIYKVNPAVQLEAYNEPNGVSQQIWAYGGMVTDGYETPGMQRIYDVIRGEGALNIVIFNGLNWGYDHKGLPVIEGVNILNGAHPYGQFEEKNDPNDFERDFGFLQDQGQAVIITEFGHSFECESDFYWTVATYAQDNNMSWITWAWWPDWNESDPSKSCGFPGIIKDWKGQPIKTGDDIKLALETPVPDASVVK